MRSGRSSCARSVHEQLDDRVGVRFESVAAPAQDPVGRHLVERAEEDFRRDRRLDVGAEDPGALTVGDGVANQPEIIAQQRGGETLHELRGLSQLHLEDDREVAIAAEAREVGAGEAAEALARIVEVGDNRASEGEPFPHAAIED
jgi:hypothetical protein